MNKNKAFKSGVCLALIVAAALIFGTTYTYALPLTNVNIGASGTGYNGWYTEYTFNAAELDGPLDAFCVEGVEANEDFTYELIPVTGVNILAVKIADYYFSKSGLNQRDFQIAIWHAADVIGGTPWETNAEDIFDGSGLGIDWSTYELHSGLVSLAHSPAEGYSCDSQDYLIAPVPEPATIMLLGVGLLGIVGAGRKKLFKK